MILSRRENDDDSRDGFTKWPFMTTHTWGEYPQGTWLLEVRFSLNLTGFFWSIVRVVVFRLNSIPKYRVAVSLRNGR